ncbi:MAG TPA: DUF262 domain-containing protein [Chitinophagales bacterium]|nr:DUF262 domain-containing protein [Chitinophagales bacterium]
MRTATTATWQINKTLYKVSDFVSWQRNGSLLLNPTFQRRSVWKPGAKSFLIDTIMKGLPIPIIFLRERQSDLNTLEPIREVVDGQQRLRTLISFIGPQFLKDYNPKRDDVTLSKSHTPEYANARFEDLPNDVKRQILDYQFSVHILPASTGDREVLQIFSRMNATGTKLNDQELRNAEFFGEFKTSVYNSALKQLNKWREWELFTDDNIARMQEVELTSDLYILIQSGITGKTQKLLDKYYSTHEEELPHREKIESRFETVLSEIDSKMGDNIAETIYKKTSYFYPLFAVVYDICFGLETKLTGKQIAKLSNAQASRLLQLSELYMAEELSPKTMEALSTRRAANQKQRGDIYKLMRSYAK